MNITYTWKITAMKMAPALDGLSDVITNVQFEYKGTDSDSGFSHSFMGAIPIGKPESSNFVPLADLTENEVIEWVKSIYNLDHPNEQIEKGIENQIVPEDKEAPLPWEPEQESDATLDAQ
tara:strand:+ start:280 stop:639 length:360 start_codon:yes stop_codon:yes gene_type:complete